MSPTPYLAPRYLPPSYLPANLEGGAVLGAAGAPYVPGSYLPATFCPPQLVGGPIRDVDLPIVLFTDQMATFIKGMLNAFAYRDKLPSRKANYPLVTYAVVAGEDELLASGPDTLAWITIQLDVYSDVASAADVLAERLRLLFRSLVGPMGKIQVAHCLPSKARSGYAISPSETDRGLYRSSRDFEFHYYH